MKNKFGWRQAKYEKNAGILFRNKDSGSWVNSQRTETGQSCLYIPWAGSEYGNTQSKNNSGTI